MVDWYPKKEQYIYLVNESAYGTPRAGTAWTAIPVSGGAAANIQRLSVIAEGVEVPLPKIEKLRKYDINAGKHPSHVASGNRPPITFTMNLECQYPVFLAYAVGLATTTGVADPYTHTVIEELGGDAGSLTGIQSFTLHCEQRHAGSEDIAYDLFGCVVEEYKLSINKADGTVKESVTISCPACTLAGNLLTTPPTKCTDMIYVFGHTKEAAGKYLLMEGTTKVRPDSVETIELGIKNNIMFLPDLAYRHMCFAIARNRDVSLHIVGYISSSKILKYWETTWDEVNERPTGASGKINAYIYLEKIEATKTHSIEIPIYNLIPEEHNCEFVAIDKGIKGADITLVDAPPSEDATYGGKIFRAAAADGIIIKDQHDETYYHHT